MMGITPFQPRPVVYATQAEQTRIATYSSRLEDDPDRGPGAKYFPTGTGPSPRQRQEMEARLKYLRWVNQPTPDENTDVIRFWRNTTRTFGETPDEADHQARTYAFFLRHFPVWAVKATADLFGRGAAPGKWDRVRGPTTPEFSVVVEGLMRETVAEARRLQTILMARVDDTPKLTEAERAAVIIEARRRDLEAAQAAQAAEMAKTEKEDAM